MSPSSPTARGARKTAATTTSSTTPNAKVTPLTGRTRHSIAEGLVEVPSGSWGPSARERQSRPSRHRRAVDCAGTCGRALRVLGRGYPEIIAVGPPVEVNVPPRGRAQARSGQRWSVVLGLSKTLVGRSGEGHGEHHRRAGNHSQTRALMLYTHLPWPAKLAGVESRGRSRLTGFSAE